MSPSSQEYEAALGAYYGELRRARDLMHEALSLLEEFVEAIAALTTTLPEAGQTGELPEPEDVRDALRQIDELSGQLPMLETERHPTIPQEDPDAHP